MVLCGEHSASKSKEQKTPDASMFAASGVCSERKENLIDYVLFWCAGCR